MVKQDYALDVSRFIEVLKQERDARNNDGLYHYIQVKFAYNSNKMEGSTLSEEQTRHIFDIGKLIVEKDDIVKTNDIIETINHFRVFDYIIDTYNDDIDDKYIKELHRILKNGIIIKDIEREIIGDFKKKVNFVGDVKTTKPSEVAKALNEVLFEYITNLEQSLDLDDKLKNIIDLHYNFEKIHPFYDGNGRVGRALLFKESLKNGIVPFVIFDEDKAYYLRGLKEYKNTKGYLLDTCLKAQDDLIDIIKEFDDLKDVLLDCKTLQSNTQQQKFRINPRTGRREIIE